MRFVRLLALMLCVATANAAAGQYSVPGLGAMDVDIPANWRVQEQPGPVSLYLRMRPAEGDAFSVQLTSNWLNKDQLGKMTREAVRQRVEAMKKDLIARAVEADVPLIEVNEKGGTGFYFSLTDRETPASASSYKHLTQGMLATSVGATVFTMLQREASAPERQQAVALVSSAGYSREPMSEAGPQGNDAMRVVERERGFVLWVPTSRLYMDLPRTRNMGPGQRVGGATNHPRYFYFVDRLFNVSGWFEPAQKFSGMQRFWESETRSWKQNGLPPPLDVVFKKVGTWDAVVYDQASTLGTNSHIRAHWVDAGTWIDIHISISGPQPSAKLREVLETYLSGVVVSDRAY